jgi:flagellar biosynthesis protein
MDKTETFNHQPPSATGADNKEPSAETEKLPTPVSHQAVALRYHPEQDEAPLVVAKGRGLIAERIETIAREAGVAVEEDPMLAEYLMKIDLLKAIPPELYTVVAHLLAHIYRVDKDFR